MKSYSWINYLSIFLIVCSLAAWYYMLPKFLSSGGMFGGKANIRVEAIQDEKQEITDQEYSEGMASPFGELIDVKLDVPVKEEGVGEMYVRAHSAIAIDSETGTILHYQDGKRKMAIASLTKIMTAVVVAENVDNLRNEIITIDEEAVLTDGTIVGCPRGGYCVSERLQVGERISALDLFDAMLINSANDAAVALGKHIAGSQEEFARMMNDKAKEIGLKDTNFCNPSGLDDEDNPGACYSTAYDLARIVAYSFKHQEIWDAMRIKEKEIYNIEKTMTHHLVSTVILLEQLPNCLGGKTGFTYEAGRSLMMAAHDPQNKDNKVVAVLLDDNYRWEDMRNLLEWIFASYKWPQN